MNKKYLVGGFIIAIMALSSLAVILDRYGSNGSTSKLKYNGHKFVQTSNGWKTTVKGRAYTFSFFPEAIQDLSIAAAAKERLKQAKAIGVTYGSSNYSQIMAQVQFYLEQALNSADLYVFRGLTEPGNYSLPKITCVNATALTPVLMLEEGERTSIALEDNCIILKAADEVEFFKAAERIIYVILGVME